ncbi:MAG: hypothetical protein K6E48_07840 [Lachnospiraceae bacterium]|nr:hypothetical protein [Lachnospiraceae bacterium]MCR5321103.1 hypothetical protein [Lachnospiraceae bacterium]
MKTRLLLLLLVVATFFSVICGYGKVNAARPMEESTQLETIIHLETEM